jgi:hypothetical protein
MPQDDIGNTEQIAEFFLRAVGAFVFKENVQPFAVAFDGVREPASAPHLNRVEGPFGVGNALFNFVHELVDRLLGRFGRANQHRLVGTFWRGSFAHKK